MAGRSVILVLFSIFCGVLARDRVPVLIWNANQVQKNVPAVPALQTIDYTTFQSKYLSAFEPKNILLFVQDALSVEDLSSHETEFAPVKEWMQHSHSLYVPNVEEPAHLAHDLPLRGYNVVVLEPGVPAAGLDLKQQDKNLVVVKLPSTLTNPSRSHALQKAVEVMQNVISKIGAKREFTVIFTGIKPSVEDSDKYDELVRVRRAVKDPRNLPGFHSVNCVKLLFKNNFTFVYNDIEENISNQPSIDNGHCDTSTGKRLAKIVMKFTEGLEHYDRLIFELNFEAVGHSWSFIDAEVVLNTTTYKNKLSLQTPAKIAGIPVGMSYVCSGNTVLASNGTSRSDSKIKLMFDGIQMEAFFKNVTNGTFGPSWDCVGFFTVPIWVSLLTTLLLVVILSMGLYMLSDIKTMDRFDDPKGQPITMATSE